MVHTPRNFRYPIAIGLFSLLPAVFSACIGIETESQYTREAVSVEGPSDECDPVLTPTPTSTPTPTPTSDWDDGGLIGVRIGVNEDTLRVSCRQTRAVLSFEGSISEFGIQSVYSKSYRVLAVKNIGVLPATGIAHLPPQAPFGFRGGAFPGTGGTCGTTLLPGASCLIVTSFEPVRIDHEWSPLKLNYFDGYSPRSLATELTGTGAAYPTLLFADEGAVDFGAKLIGTTSQRTLVVKYAGIHPASGISASALNGSFAFKGGSYPGQGGTCGTEIAADCTLVVEFSPASSGAQQQTLKLDYNNGAFAADAQIALTGIGMTLPTPARLTIEPATPGGQEFGTHLVGSPSTQIFIVKNSGTNPANNVAATFGGANFKWADGSYPGTFGTCGNIITSECRIAVSFTPAAAGKVQDQIRFTYSDDSGQEKQTALAISGTGILRAVLQASTSAIDFGAVPLHFNSQVQITVTNLSQDLSISKIELNGLSVPFTASPVCGSSLSPGASCKINLTFKSDIAGVFAQDLSIGYFDGFSEQAITVQLVGGTTEAAKLVFEPATHSFGNVVLGSSSTKIFTVRYFGGQPATGIHWNDLSGPDFFYDGGTCSTLIYADCTVAIKFVPSAARPFNSVIQLLYNDGTGPQTAPLAVSGIGKRPALLSAATLDFGKVPVGGSKTATMTITNVGEVQAKSIAKSALAAPFSFNGGTCGATLDPGKTCTIGFKFTPRAAGHFEQNLKLQYDDGLGPNLVDLPIKGDATSDGNIDWGGAGGSTTLSYDFGSIVIGKEKTATFTLNYTGLSPAMIQSVTVLEGPDFYYDNEAGFPGTGTCGNSISASCTIKLKFKPSARGYASKVFTLVYSDGTVQKTLTLTLKGKGLSPARLTFTPANDPFPHTPLNYTREKTVTVSNSASSDTNLKMNGISSLNVPFRILGGSCTTGAFPKTLAPGASCTIQLSFKPVAAQTVEQLLTVQYDNGATVVSVSYAISGTGIEDALLAARSKGTVDFGSVVIGNRKPLTIDLDYFGSKSATILNTVVTGPFELSGTGSCGATVTGSCNLIAQFVPTQSGAATGNIRITYDDGAGHSKDLLIPFAGSGKEPGKLEFSPSVKDFGQILIGHSATASFIVAKSGEFAPTEVSLDSVAAPFSIISTDCAGTVTANCRLQISFRPLQTGSFSQTLALRYFDGATTRETQAVVTGTALAAAMLSSTPVEFGSVRVGNEMTRQLNISNTGTATASSIMFPSLPSGFHLLSQDCGELLNPGSSCKLTIQFRPTRPGLANNALSISYYDGAKSAIHLAELRARATIPAQLATKGDHSCAINDIGQVKCWGRNDYGQAGPGGFIDLGDNLSAVSIATGYWHSCALLADGRVKCWGRNNYGQLGLGDSLNRGALAQHMGDNLPVVDLGSSRRALAIALGYSHSCALLDDESVRCWGENSMGQLGLGDTRNRGTLPSDMGDALPGLRLGTGAKAKQLTINAGHGCAVLDSGKLKCWGDNFYGQLGLGDFANRGRTAAEMGDDLPFVNVGTGRSVLSVSAGGGFTCALLSDASTKCWGVNYHGTLGTCWALDSLGNSGSCFDPLYREWTRGYGLRTGEMGDHLPIVDFGPAAFVSQISSGSFFTCAILADGKAKCFGENGKGQLGLGDTNSRGDEPDEMGASLPALEFSGASAIRSIHAGNEHACALFTDDAVRCWGSNSFGQLDVDSF